MVAMIPLAAVHLSALAGQKHPPWNMKSISWPKLPKLVRSRTSLGQAQTLYAEAPHPSWQANLNINRQASRDHWHYYFHICPSPDTKD